MKIHYVFKCESLGRGSTKQYVLTMKDECDHPKYQVVNDKDVILPGVDAKIIKSKSDKNYQEAFNLALIGPLGAPSSHEVQFILKEREYSCFGLIVDTKLDTNPKTKKPFWVVTFSIVIGKRMW